MSMQSRPRYWVVIPAAGMGTRMLSDVPKQYLKLGEKTVLEHTLSIFDSSLESVQLVVCLAPNDDQFEQLIVSDKVMTALGGETRGETVLNGLCEIDADDSDWVIVHDAARPCLSRDLLVHFVEQLSDDEVGGILAVPAKDTLKQASVDRKINQTIDRSMVWQAQTPQMFRYRLLRESLNAAINANATITDEASALEWAGYSPRLIEGEARNIKVTTPDDLLFAEFLLETKGSTI